jgi:hypothetical protein
VPVELQERDAGQVPVEPPAQVGLRAHDAVPVQVGPPAQDARRALALLQEPVARLAPGELLGLVAPPVLAALQGPVAQPVLAALQGPVAKRALDWLPEFVEVWARAALQGLVAPPVPPSTRAPVAAKPKVVGQDAGLRSSAVSRAELAALAAGWLQAEARAAQFRHAASAPPAAEHPELPAVAFPFSVVVPGPVRSQASSERAAVRREPRDAELSRAAPVGLPASDAPAHFSQLHVWQPPEVAGQAPYSSPRAAVPLRAPPAVRVRQKQIGPDWWTPHAYAVPAPRQEAFADRAPPPFPAE